MAQAVDYDALAKQQGGRAEAPAPDFDALASQFGGTSVPDFKTETKASEMPWAQILETASAAAGHPIPQEIADVFIGAGKMAGQSVVNLGKIAHWLPVSGHILRAVNQHLFGLTPEQQRTAFAEADKALTRTSTAQKIGAAGEQLAEVLLPAAKIEQAATTATRTAGPILERVLPKVAARVMPRMAVESAAGAAQATLQGGDPTTGAVFGAAAPVVAKGVGAVAGKVSEKLTDSAERLVQQALGPRKERYKAIAERLTPEILKRGLRGSRESLLEQAAEALERSGDDMDTLLATVGTQPVSVQPVVDALERSKDAFRTPKVMSISDALTKGVITLKNGAVVQSGQVKVLPNNMVEVLVELEPRTIRQLNGLQHLMEQVGPVSDVAQLRAIRQAWDKVVAQAGGYAHRAGGAIGVPLKDQSEAWAKREGASAIRELLAADVPELAAINKEYSFWKNLQDVVTQTVQRSTPQEGGLGRQIAEGIGVAAGSHAGVSTALVLGKVKNLAHRAFTSPRWRLMSAQYKNDLAEAIMAGNLGRTAGLLSRVVTVEGAKVDFSGAAK